MHVTILAGIYGDPTFFNTILVLSVGSHPVQVLLIQSDLVQVLSMRSDPIRSDPGFVSTPKNLLYNIIRILLTCEHCNKFIQ